jgi:hypothetical protein
VESFPAENKMTGFRALETPPRMLKIDSGSGAARCFAPPFIAETRRENGLDAVASTDVVEIF